MKGWPYLRGGFHILGYNEVSLLEMVSLWPLRGWGLIRTGKCISC